MASVRVHARIAAPADQVWETVADTGNIADWFGPIVKSSQTGDIRTVELDGGPTLEERIVTSDGELRRMQYVIFSGIPVEHHLATVDVLEDGEGSLVVYGTDVKPDEIGETILGAITAGIQGLKEYSEARR